MGQSTRLPAASEDEGATERASENFEHDSNIDPVKVVRAIGMDNVQHIDAVSGGSDTLIWRLETAAGPFALRLFRSDQTEAARREAAAMTAARDKGLPAPSIVQQGVWGDRPAVVISWMPGRTLREAMLAHPEAAEALGEAFGREQARIHSCPAAGRLRESDPRWVEAAGADAENTSAVRRACAQTHRLLHLDYHPLNVLVEQGAISAILDWTNARSGDPRCDLARTETILTFVPLQDHETLAARNALISGWRRGYTALANPVNGMEPFRAWAAAFMLHDLRPRLGRPDLPWLTAELLERVRDWTTAQHRQPEASWF